MKDHSNCEAIESNAFDFLATVERFDLVFACDAEFGFDLDVAFALGVGKTVLWTGNDLLRERLGDT